jgi:uncharacterized protein YndB with AHSA1/START domain
MSISPTGRIVNTANGLELLLERTYRAPIRDVWESIVDPARMNRWIGTWHGEAGPGKRVKFAMTAEGEAPEEDVLIHACEAPRHLDVESSVGEGTWRMTVDLAEADGATILTFRQAIDPADEAAPSYGPGWEYYADRLGAVLDGADFAAWDEYYPAQLDYWSEQIQQASAQAS